MHLGMFLFQFFEQLQGTPDLIGFRKDSLQAYPSQPVLTEGVQRLIDIVSDDEGPFSPDAASAGKRALRNSALTWLSYADASPARMKQDVVAEAGNLYEVTAANAAALM